MAQKNVIYDDYTRTFEIRGKPRKEFRDAVVNKFLSEKGGYWESGVKHVTRYKYFVEKLQDGRRIFLLRPTFLNKGIDFQVWVERFTDDKDAKPSHKNVFEDLRRKRAENPKKLTQLIGAIERVWTCEEPDAVLKDNPSLKFRAGFSVELLLKILKWLFIEQDITYWNYDGRGMLMQAIYQRTETDGSRFETLSKSLL